MYFRLNDFAHFHLGEYFGKSFFFNAAATFLRHMQGRGRTGEPKVACFAGLSKAMRLLVTSGNRNSRGGAGRKTSTNLLGT